jgi:hypothetical protein
MGFRGSRVQIPPSRFQTHWIIGLVPQGISAYQRNSLRH